MSDNVNLLITKMSSEQKWKESSSRHSSYSSPNPLFSNKNYSQQGMWQSSSFVNSDKAIQNLLQEKQRLLKRRQELSEPNYLFNLKRDLKTTEQ